MDWESLDKDITKFRSAFVDFLSTWEITQQNDSVYLHRYNLATPISIFQIRAFQKKIASFHREYLILFYYGK